MSFQTITDIISSSSQFLDFQKSVNLEARDLPSDSKTQSFGDLVSSYSEKTDERKIQSSENEVSDSVKSENQTAEDKTEKKASGEVLDSPPKKETLEVPEKNLNIQNRNSENEKIDTLVINVEEIDFEEVFESKLEADEKLVSKKSDEPKVLKKVSSENEKKQKPTQVKQNEKNTHSVNEIPVQNSKIKNQEVNVESKTEENANEITVEFSLLNEDELQTDFSRFTENQEFNLESDNSEEKFSFENHEKENNGLFLDSEQKISVSDQRTQKIASSSENRKSGFQNGDFLNSPSENEAARISLTSANVLASDSQSASANGSDFQAMLSNQIQNNASEIVKTGSIILKDNNQGTINLVLHPDDLGNVKIHLSMDGKTLSGHIAVSTKEALQVFKDNAETLREAFIKSGFDVSSFDVSLNSGSFADRGENGFAQEEAFKFMGRKVYNSYAQSESGLGGNVLENFFENSNYSINIVA